MTLKNIRSYQPDLVRPLRPWCSIGIGGSDLGPRALYEALKVFRLSRREARFIANVDPDDAAGVLDGLDLSTTLFNVVSKSGTTLETRTNEQLIRRALVRAGLDPAQHVIAVTGKGSPTGITRNTTWPVSICSTT